jgi:ribosomal protein S30
LRLAPSTAIGHHESWDQTGKTWSRTPALPTKPERHLLTNQKNLIKGPVLTISLSANCSKPAGRGPLAPFMKIAD